MTVDLADSDTIGYLGVLHLERLWSRSQRDRHGLSRGGEHADEWALDNLIYHGLNLPIEETIQFLYQEGPSFEEFETWILRRNGGTIHKNVADRLNAAIKGLNQRSEPRAGVERILTQNQLSFWNANGYLVVPGVCSADEVAAAEDVVWRHLKMDRDDPESWYSARRDHGIMVQLFHDPTLEVIRRSQVIRNVFAHIWETPDLLVSTDRVSFNPPERPGFPFPGPRLHWDVSLELPIPLGVQGLVYLTDTAAHQGAFTCVPGFHTRIEPWLKSLPPETDPRTQDLDSLGAVPIPGNAGDLVIWHQALPHGSSPNLLTRPRIVQYVTMFPVDAEYATNWK